MRHATYGLVEQQTGAGRTGQSLVVEGVIFITSGVRSDRTDETFFNTIKQLGDGSIGKLRRRKSGALELQLGDNTLTLSSGTPVNFLQELFAIDDKADPTEMVNVGFVNEKYTASPSVSHLLRDMKL